MLVLILLSILVVFNLKQLVLWTNRNRMPEKACFVGP